MKRKRFEVKIDQADLETGVFAGALVDAPAIEVDYIALSKLKESHTLKLSTEDKTLLVGPFLIPDFDIVRQSKDGELYDIFYTKETIKQIQERYFELDKHKNFNLMHDQNQKIEATVVESWIIQDSELDKAKALGFDLPAGTWMVSVKPKDKTLIENEKYKGFSIEGKFNLDLIEQSMEGETILGKIRSILGLNQIEPEIQIVEKIIIQTKFIMLVKTKDGLQLNIDDTDKKVYAWNAETSANGDLVADGSYDLESGEVLIVTNGVGEVKAMETPDPAPAVEVEVNQLKLEVARLNLELAKLMDNTPAAPAANPAHSNENVELTYEEVRQQKIDKNRKK